MYLDKHSRRVAALDPSFLERERSNWLDYQRRERLLDSIDKAADRVALYARRFGDQPTSYNRRALERGKARLEHFTAAAERAGLTRPRKDLAQ